LEREIHAVRWSYSAHKANLRSDLESLDNLQQVLIEGIETELQTVRAKSLEEQRSLKHDALRDARAEQEKN
jgi:hypothetical protein